MAIPLKGFQIRTARASDLSSICRIENDSFSSPYPPYLLEKLLGEYPDSFFVAAEASGDLVGYCVATKNHETAHVISIGVLPKDRRRGVATSLMRTMIEYLLGCGVSELRLEVKTNNAEAIKLYDKLGFERLTILDNYYADGSPALRMQLALIKRVRKTERNGK